MNELMSYLMRGWRVVFSMQYNSNVTYVYLQNSARWSFIRTVGLWM